MFSNLYLNILFIFVSIKNYITNLMILIHYCVINGNKTNDKNIYTIKVIRFLFKWKSVTLIWRHFVEPKIVNLKVIILPIMVAHKEKDHPMASSVFRRKVSHWVKLKHENLTENQCQIVIIEKWTKRSPSSDFKSTTKDLWMLVACIMSEKPSNKYENYLWSFDFLWFRRTLLPTELGGVGGS